MVIRSYESLLWCACFVFFLASFFLAPGIARGATLYIDPLSTDVLKGDSVTVAVRLDTDEGECINTIDAVVSYSEGIQAVDVSRGRSILSLWVEEPHINVDERRITFAGGIPNGYCGRIPGDPSLTNVIAEIVFRAPGFSIGASDNKQVTVSFEPGTRALLNDGSGTDAPLRTIDGTINLLQQVGNSANDAWRATVEGDKADPQPFGVELVQNPDVFGGKYYIVFNTVDKQSGIDHYEVFEESREDLYTFRWGRADTPWVVAESPFVLEDQTLSSIIRVRAIDKAGNEQITVLVPDDAIRPFNILFFVLVGVMALVVLVMAAGAAWLVYRRYKGRKAAPESAL